MIQTSPVRPAFAQLRYGGWVARPRIAARAGILTRGREC